MFKSVLLDKVSAVKILKLKVSSTVFLVHLGGNQRKLIFLLISTVNFYYVINKLIILVPINHLKYLYIGTFYF
jgi:hypothetical protein